MSRKTPADVINDAVNQLPAALVFNNEAAAIEWASNHVASVLRHRFEQRNMNREERDVVDPIDAGYIHAKDLGTRPRRQRIPWIDAMLTEVAEACFCELVPLSGTMSSWLIGRRSDRASVMQLVGSLIPTAERLGQDAYLKEYHAHRRAGEVEGARGFKEQWHMRMIEMFHEACARQAAAVIEQHPEAEATFRAARLDLSDYMNENFLPTRGNRNVRKGGK